MGAFLPGTYLLRLLGSDELQGLDAEILSVLGFFYPYLALQPSVLLTVGERKIVLSSAREPAYLPFGRLITKIAPGGCHFSVLHGFRPGSKFL